MIVINKRYMAKLNIGGKVEDSDLNKKVTWGTIVNSEQ